MRRRLVEEMVRRGLAADPTEAAQAIRAGRVTVSGRVADKGETLVLDAEPITMAMAPPAGAYASRAGKKLEAALIEFGIDVTGARALDAGASTGGFTDCLLARGASQVTAVDVGYGLLDWRLRQDRRVSVLERMNVRDLRPEQLPYPPDMVTADLSFISLGTVLPALARCSLPDATFVLLVKPQFEATRADAQGGVVKEPSVWRSVLEAVAQSCVEQGLRVLAVMASPLRGPAGNVEFLVHATRSGPEVGRSNAPPDDLAGWIATAVRQGEALSSPSHA